MDKSIECCICTNDFSQPKQLPCFHSFCLKCLTKYCEEESDGDLKPCPLCRKKFRIPRGGVKQLKSDNIIERLLIEKRLQEESQREKCELCVELEEVEAEYFCMDCQQSLCERCQVRHLKQSFSKLHRLESIEDKPSEMELQRMKSNYCDVHSTELIKLYCCDCKMLICMICHATGHSGHKCQVPFDTAKSMKQLSSKYNSILERYRTESRTKLNRAKLRASDDVLAKSKNDIREARRKCLELLENHTRKLLLKVDEFEKIREKSVKNQSELDQFRYVELDGFIAYSRMVMERGTDCEIIRVADELHKRAEELIKSHVEYSKQAEDEKSVRFVASADPSEELVQDLLGRFLYTGEWETRELEVSPVVEAQWRGSAEMVESTLTTLIEALQNCQCPHLMSKIEEALKKLQSSSKFMKEQKQLGQKLIISPDLFDHLNSATKALSEKLNQKAKSGYGKLRILVMVGLDPGEAMDQGICQINLDRKNKISFNNSSPAWIEREATACGIRNNLYCVGLGTARNELWKWSMNKDKWSKLADLPISLRRHCATSVGEKIYVLGGWVDADKRTLDTVLCYDISSNNWTQKAKLLHSVWGAVCVAYEHNIYVFGGTDKTNNSVNHVQLYDTSSDSTTLSSYQMPDAHRAMRAVLWGSKALLIGDWTCYIFDFEKNTWEERNRFKTDLIQFGLTLNDNKLYISGGGALSLGANDEIVWMYSDEVKSLSVDDFISDNRQAEWKHHAKLPMPTRVHLFNSLPLSRYI